MDKIHPYSLTIEWTGNTGEGTKNYCSYERSHTITVNNKVVIEGSSDAAFRGDAAKHSPEDLFVASIASCHMLWYLHLCSDAGIVITAYKDEATGTMVETSTGSGHFTEVVLHPVVTITNEAMQEVARELHVRANELCFVANSCNFPIHHEPSVVIAAD